MAHLTTVTLNIFIFLLRYYWMLQRSGWVRKKAVRKISTTNDTVLLIAGMSMAVMSQQYPFYSPWLTTKLLALLAYIVFGSIALNWGRTIRIRTYSGLIAIGCVFYIVTVAYSRTPKSWVLLGLH